MRRQRVTAVGLLQAVAIVTVLFSVVTSFDFLHRYVELFSHFRLQYLAVSLLLLITFAILRQPAYAGLLIAVTLFNASYTLPWYLDGALAASNNTLKILHANVLSTNDHYDRLLELVKAEDADIVLLQEVTPQWQAAMRPLLEKYPYNLVEARDGNFGIAMFSRVAFDAVTHVDSPPLQFPSIVARLTIGGTALTLISTHPMMPLGESNYAARNEQLKSVADIVTRANGAVVLAGDLNTAMWGANYRTLLHETKLRNARRGFGILPTWPTFMPIAMIPIDHVLVSSEVGVNEIRTGPGIGSDHLPLIATVAF